MNDMIIRRIQPTDNATIAEIIRSSLKEFGADHYPGTVYFDPTTDDLASLFITPRSAYFIAESKGEILGGAGIYPSDGLPADTCELVKMYLKPQARNQGLGGRMISTCIEFAREAGYKQVYIESLPELKKAVHIYERFGFRHLPGPLGQTGHFSCTIWMLKEL